MKKTLMRQPRRPMLHSRYAGVRDTQELGEAVRAYRKGRGVSLRTVSHFGNLSPRFLSEFERGKDTVELGKVLKVLYTLGLEMVIQPRNLAISGAPDLVGPLATIREELEKQKREKEREKRQQELNDRIYHGR